MAAPVTFDLPSLGFVEQQEDVIFRGPAGVGKTLRAAALGHTVCRPGYHVLFLRADQLFTLLHQTRPDHPTEKVLRRLLALHVLVVGGFRLCGLDAQQSTDLYEVILERHRRASPIVTSDRTIHERIPLLDDPILGQSGIDRVAHNAY